MDIGCYVKLLDWLSLCSDRFKKKEFQFVSESVVKQTNGSDCGVFTCKFADCLLSPDMPLWEFNNSQLHVRTWLLDKLFEYHRLLHKDELKNSAEIEAMLVSVRDGMKSSLNSSPSTHAISNKINATSVQKFFKSFEHQLVGIAKREVGSELLNTYRGSEKFQSGMKLKSYGIAIHYLNDAEVDSLMEICLKISEMYVQYHEYVPFTFAIDILFPEAFIHFLMEVQEMSYEDATDLYLKNDHEIDY